MKFDIKATTHETLKHTNKSSQVERHYRDRENWRGDVDKKIWHERSHPEKEHVVPDIITMAVHL